MIHSFFVRALAIGLVFGSLAASALVLNNETIPYYGAAFYTEVHNGDRDAALVSDLQTVLTSPHQRSKSGLDQVVQHCDVAASGCYQQNPIGYTAARKAILGKLHLVQNGAGYAVNEVYCGRPYTDADFPSSTKPGPGILLDDKVINIEHTWPQSRFSKAYAADVQKCDLHHLFPSDSKLNGIRGNFKFAEVDGQKQALKCGMSKFGTSNGRGQFFEPPDHHKGNVARALFYFSVRYKIAIDPQEEAFLKKWNKADPVDDEERTRNDDIQKIQGNRNPFVDFPELVDQIQDF